MPRSLEIAVAPELTDEIVAGLRAQDGLLGLRVIRGASVQPDGDLVVAQLTSPALHRVMNWLEGLRLAERTGLSASISQPLVILSPGRLKEAVRDSTNTTPEEMEALIGREANMGANGMLLMAASGAVAVIGLATNALHIVLGAMLFAPGFEPILRISLGITGSAGAARTGLVHTARGYGALLIGATAVAGVFRLLAPPEIGVPETYLDPNVLVNYWRGITWHSVAASALAALAGAVLISTNRSVLASGVMAALALVPSAALIGVGIVRLDPGLIGVAALRWGIDVALVLGIGAAVLAWKRRVIYRRRSVL